MEDDKSYKLHTIKFDFDLLTMEEEKGKYIKKCESLELELDEIKIEFDK